MERLWRLFSIPVRIPCSSSFSFFFARLLPGHDISVHSKAGVATYTAVMQVPGCRDRYACAQGALKRSLIW